MSCRESEQIFQFLDARAIAALAVFSDSDCGSPIRTEWQLLRQAFELATDLTEAGRAEDEGGDEALSLLPDPRIGALTALLREAAPDQAPHVVERVVLDVDEIVRQTRFGGWAQSGPGDRAVRAQLFKVLHRHRLHKEPGLYEKAYKYVAANF